MINRYFLAVCALAVAGVSMFPGPLAAQQRVSAGSAQDICGLMSNPSRSPSGLTPRPLPGTATATATAPVQPNRWASMGLTALDSRWVCWSPVPQKQRARFTSIVVQDNGSAIVAGSFTAESGPVPGQEAATVQLFASIISQEVRMNEQELAALKVLLTTAFQKGTDRNWVPVFEGSQRFVIYRQEVGAKQFTLTLNVLR